MASLSELIKEIGDDNVTVQSLHQCMTDAKYDRGHTTIKFGTNGLGAMDLVNNKKTALIVWIDAGDFNEALAKLKGEKDD